MSALAGLQSGCAELQDAIVRNLHMDHGYYRKVLPELNESYRRKMEREPARTGPAKPAPEGLDQAENSRSPVMESSLRMALRSGTIRIQ